MAQLRSVYPIPGAERPTVASLIAHFKAYGLSEKVGYRKKLQRYGSYKSLAKDPLIEVGFDYLGENAYAHLIEAVGYSQFTEAAREDWKAEHQENEE